MNSDGLVGFYYSHVGYWKGKAMGGVKTIKECAKACLQDCVAFSVYHSAFRGYDMYCYHFDQLSDKIDLNHLNNATIKSYVKCEGKLDHLCLKIVSMPIMAFR